jgi:hypothetical protein
MEEFKNIHEQNSLLTERHLNTDSLYIKLKGDLRATGSSRYDLVEQLRTIQELREQIDFLEGQLNDDFSLKPPPSNLHKSGRK